jgi:membrane-associated phospholipid phosphatase
MGAGLATWTLFRDDVLGMECRICDGAEVNGLDRWFRDRLKRDDVMPARTISNILSYGVAPLTLATLSVIAAADHGQLNDAPADLLLITEGVMASLVVSEALKPLTLRERPDYHAASEGERARYPIRDEPLLSFPSGHGGTIIAMTSAAGVIAHRRGYRLEPLIWIAGLLLGTTSYMRLAADRHYFTDVLAGYAVGFVVGGGVPWLFHRPRTTSAPQASSSSIPTLGMVGTRGVTLTWVF